MRGRSATTILEMLVVMALLGVVTTLVYFIIQAGMAFYLDSTTAMEIREEALVGMTRLTTDLRQTTMASVSIDMTSPTTGIVFACPRDSSGNLSPTIDGKYTWQQLIGYYVAPYMDSSALFRNQESIAPPLVRAPDPMGLVPPRNPTYFAGLVNPRVIARELQAFNLTATTGSIQIQMTCQLSVRHLHSIQLETTVVPNLL